MGLQDRDWYWWRRARGSGEDHDALFPNHRWPARRSTVYPTILAVLGVLGLLIFGLHQGWFDRDWRSRADRIKAEIAAERAWEAERPGVRPPQAAHPRVTPPAPTFHEKYRLPIEFTLLGFLILSPFVLLGLLVCLFSRRLRGPALIGLVFGPLAAYFSGQLFVSGAWFRWGLLYPADSMGGAFQFFEVVIASFAIAAIVGAIVTFVFVKPGSPSASTGT